MRKSYRPKFISTDDLNETLWKIEAKARQYAMRRDEARKKYDDFLAWSQECPDEVAEWREERERDLKNHGSLMVDDDPVEIYEVFLKNGRDEKYLADAEKLRAIIVGN